jgi:hypothetical protein
MFPKKYLTQYDVDPPIVVTISALRMEDMRSDKGGTKRKWIITFSEPDTKEFVANPTNIGLIGMVLGEESDEWIGKQIELWRNPEVMMGTERTGGIRARAPSSGSWGGPLSWGGAVELAKSVGMSKDGLVAALKAHGRGSYSPSKDQALVQQIVDSIDSPSGGDGGWGDKERDDSVPF